IEHLRRLQNAQWKFGQRNDRSLDAHSIQAADFDPVDRKILRRNQFRFDAPLRAYKANRVAARPQFASYGERRHHVSAGSSTRHHERCGSFHPSFSLTLNSIPSEASVLNMELPPKLIMGNGNPFVGAMSNTT